VYRGATVPHFFDRFIRLRMCRGDPVIEPIEIKRLRTALGRATLDAQRNPADPVVARQLDDAREAYTVAKIADQLSTRLAGMSLSDTARARLVALIAPSEADAA
jgi:hypothetical protein